ncbi:M23 family metallopeptidase [Clostridium luticellarii]|jgi:murein DD-endopeptidase MepM/ murein hydrolase activator NlpD|uniref:Putative peptidase n=1 Tax=Clostridium luticellarii TaxID=1691940 RepID=A0A2T0BQN7_9CLOT|nr:M23 family metallopeptidase [Clostridium luticellarii]MCI1945318.1 M23 family metallopeptidase [Clostridium luticellarii]MCI1968621.1 M23 family metallopeptidase [Clostridium luticellarii]MCI1995801.1 M23 family metallopeptidase [Clostridium luticellarii]MCI2040095.1 M23 family metallopeptidase [Clostridium luticellarii]PRR86193.1 putative peptidase [Clostridium luticellarii]
MDKKFSNKAANFFKKEGFYVILFICLCIVATVALLTARNNKNQSAELQKQRNEAIEQKQVKQTAKADKNSSTSYDNALQVKKAGQANANAQKETSKEVSNSMSTSFQKPVEGVIARGFSEDPVYWDSTGTYRPNLGYDIQTDLGKPVFAAMDGKVEAVNTATQDGVEIILDHQNGLKTVYSNLDPNVKVSVGKIVKKGTVIGIVGKTTLRSAYEKYGNHLHFAVIKGKEFADPGKYIKY